jgi:hypothetical protein
MAMKNRGVAIQVGDRPRDLQDPVVTACRQLELAGSGGQELAR